DAGAAMRRPLASAAGRACTMGRSTLVRLAVVALVAGLLCGGDGVARADDVVIPAGREGEVIKVIAPYGLDCEVAEGFRITDIRIGQRRIDVVLGRTSEPEERVTFALTVRSGS